MTNREKLKEKLKDSEDRCYRTEDGKCIIDTINIHKCDYFDNCIECIKYFEKWLNQES